MHLRMECLVAVALAASTALAATPQSAEAQNVTIRVATPGYDTPEAYRGYGPGPYWGYRDAAPAYHGASPAGSVYTTRPGSTNTIIIIQSGGTAPAPVPTTNTIVYVQPGAAGPVVSQRVVEDDDPDLAIGRAVTVLSASDRRDRSVPAATQPGIRAKSQLADEVERVFTTEPRQAKTARPVVSTRTDPVQLHPAVTVASQRAAKVKSQPVSAVRHSVSAEPRSTRVKKQPATTTSGAGFTQQDQAAATGRTTQIAKR